MIASGTYDNRLGLAESRKTTLLGRGIFAFLPLTLGILYITHPVQGLAHREFAESVAPMWAWGTLFVLQGLFAVSVMFLDHTKLAVGPYWTGLTLFIVWATINAVPAFEDFDDTSLAPAVLHTFAALTFMLRLLSEVRMWATHTHLDWTD